MPKQTFTLRTPDGVEHRRTSDKHVYICASIGQVPATYQDGSPIVGPEASTVGQWRVITWHRSAQKAPKNLYGFYSNIALVEVSGG